MAVFLGSIKGLRVGINLALAIALHNVPEPTVMCTADDSPRVSARSSSHGSSSTKYIWRRLHECSAVIAMETYSLVSLLPNLVGCESSHKRPCRALAKRWLAHRLVLVDREGGRRVEGACHVRQVIAIEAGEIHLDRLPLIEVSSSIRKSGWRLGRAASSGRRIHIAGENAAWGRSDTRVGSAEGTE
ncbi:Zinc transporter [Nymphaea thermarum]|nr:Zinc transporter [Nymphaea thermarum]